MFRSIEFAFFLILLCASCKKDCLNSTGNMVNESRELPAFSVIQNFDNIDVILEKNPFQKVRIEAGENLLSNITTDVQMGVLTIKNKNNCNWVRNYKVPVKVFISQPGLATIFHYGKGQITTLDTLPLSELLIHQYGAGDIALALQSNHVMVDINGMGNVTLKGKAERMSAHIYNPGFFRFGVLNSSGLICKDCTIRLESEANAYVYSDSLVNAIIGNTGSIYLSGRNKVYLEKTGSGNIVLQ